MAQHEPSAGPGDAPGDPGREHPDYEPPHASGEPHRHPPADETIALSAPHRVYDAGDGEVVVYDPASGNTHLLTAAGAAVIERLQAAGGRSSARHLCGDSTAHACIDGVALDDLLADLEELDLIRRAR